MSFLEEFDRRKDAQSTGRKPDNSPPEGEAPENRELLDFADLIRARQAVPNDEERQRLLARVREKNSARTPVKASFAVRWSAFAALIALAIGAAILTVTTAPGPKRDLVAEKDPVIREHTERQTDLPDMKLAHTSSPIFGSNRKPNEEFANLEFPRPQLREGNGASAVETKVGADSARLVRVQGLAMFQLKGESRWRVGSRGQVLSPGDTVRASKRLDSCVRILGPDGSAVSLSNGAATRYDGRRAWQLLEGTAHFEVASRKDLAPFTATTPHGTAKALGTKFTLDAGRTGGAKSSTLCWVDEGKVAVAVRNKPELELGSGASALLSQDGILPNTERNSKEWLAALERIAAEDNGVGRLVAKAEKANEHLPLEIKSHSVSVTVVDQVARTFVDQVFVNNTDRRLEGVFYYPLPPDASISEFAMYVGDQRIIGEVLEQQHARQIFEYIVRQQRDPALLEYAGGNLFKMRVFPIEPHSEKRIQLGYTQILTRSNGKVTYTYPLYSEMLLKNPLHDLKIEFRVISTPGLNNLASPTHDAPTAIDNEGQRGALAFHAKNYSPTRDFTVTYNVPDGAECVAFSNLRPDDPLGYFMVQLCPKAQLPQRDPPQRLLVLVDGSASAGPQEYAVATEFTASAADVSGNWQFGVLRAGQKPQSLGALAYANADTSANVRDFLQKSQPLGATDLLESFRQAASMLKPDEGIQLVYVGDGIDTVSELSGPALVKEIVSLFKGKHVKVSTVAVGSSYDRLVLQSIAAKLGGTFTRVEGAADVHGAVGQVFDSFYRPLLWDVMVNFEEVHITGVFPEFLGTVAAGDTAIVLGRYDSNKAVKGRIKILADVAGKLLERSYDINLNGDEQSNRFLPRLWAKAQIDALLGSMGVGSASDDSQTKQNVIQSSINYQIMSPFTAFLVLESEEDYARFGIKRKMKMMDWNGDAANLRGDVNGIESDGKSFAFKGGKEAVYYRSLAESVDGPAQPITSADESFALELDKDVDEFYIDDARALRKSLSDDEFAELAAQEIAGEQLLAEDFADDNLSVVSEKLGRLQSKSQQFAQRLELADEFSGRFSTRSGGGRRRYNYGGYHHHSNQYSLVFQGKAKLVELQVDQPTRPALYYQRIAASGKGTLSTELNLVLALEQAGRNDEALKLLMPLLEKVPASIDLRLQEAVLRYRTGDAAGGKAAFAHAKKLVAEKETRSLDARIANLLMSLGKYEEAAVIFSTLARNSDTADEALPYAYNAVNSYQNSGKLQHRMALWDEVLKRWPENAKVLAAAGTFAVTYGDLDLGIQRVAAARKIDSKVSVNLVSPLIQRGKRAEALAEFQYIVQTTTDSNQVYSALSGLSSDNALAADEAIKILSGDSSSAVQIGATQYFYSYSSIRNRKMADAILAATERPGFPAQARMNAFYAIMNVRGQGFVNAFNAIKFFEPLLGNPRTDEEWNYATQAASNLARYGLNKEALEAAEKLLQRHDIPDVSRRAITLTVINALNSLGRQKEAEEKSIQAAAAAKDEHAAYQAGMTAFSNRLGRQDFESAAEIVESFVKRFPESGYASQYYTQLLQHLKQNKKKDEAAVLIEALVKKYPGNTVYAEMHARALASSGKFREAADAVRAAIEALEVPLPAAPRQLEEQPVNPKDKGNLEQELQKREQLLELRREQRDSLIRLLAMLCAQDAELRAAFLKEAESNAKSEDPAQREWTEAALACLNAAGDVDAALKRLQALAAAEPNDPIWTRRFGQMLNSQKKYAEARKVLAAVSDKEPDDAELALTLNELSTRLKDAASAETYFVRAFESLKRQPSQLQQYAGKWQQNKVEWSLKAYTHLLELPSYQSYAGYQAAYFLQQLGREKEAAANYFKVILAEDGSYAQSALQNLISLCNKEELLRPTLASAHQALTRKPDAGKAVYLNLLVYSLEKVRATSFTAAPGKESPLEIARRALDAAITIKLPENDYSIGNQVVAALVQENQFERAEKYAIEGGGNLVPDARRNLMRQSANSYFNRDGERERGIRLLRRLLENPDSNSENDHWQLSSLLVQNGQLHAAEELARKLPATRHSWVKQNVWNAVINAQRQKNNHIRAAELAVEAWLAMREDSSYSGSAFSQLMSTCHEAMKQGRKLPPEIEKTLKENLREFARTSFAGENKDYPWNHAEYNLIDNLGLRSDFTAMAREAGASDHANRVAIAAEYFRHSANQPEEAKKLYRRAISLPGGDNSNTHNQLYQLLIDRNNNRIANWGDAIEVLEKIKALKGMNENSYLRERGRCLYGLKRTDEARDVFRKLLAKPDYLRGGYWNIQNIANEMQHNFKDFVMATEAWELAIKMIRRQSRRQIDAGTAAQFYESCAEAYAQLGDKDKALDSFLRGMSVVPRNNSAYQRILEAALKAVLKGETLDKSVAEYEKNVAASGGAERPHLRIAFAEGYRKANDSRKMLKHLSVAADLLPKDTELRLQVIEGYKQLKDTDAALSAYRDWAKFDTQNIEIYRGMGDLLHSLGRNEDALMAWATMAEIRPREAEGYRAYAQKLVQVNRIDKAAVALRHAIRYRPTEFEISKELSEVYAKLKQADRIPALWTAGETACRKAMEDFADDPQPWLNLGLFLRAQNRLSDERDLYMQIQQRAWPRFQNETRTEVLTRLQKMK